MSMGLLDEIKKDLYGIGKDIVRFQVQLEEFKKNEGRLNKVLENLTERVIRLEEKVAYLRTDVKEDILNVVENEILKRQLKIIDQRLSKIEQDIPLIEEKTTQTRDQKDS